MPNILKLVSHHFIVYPFSRLDIRRRPPTLHPLTLSQFPHGNYFAMHRPHSVSIWLEAAYDPSITNQTRPELWVIERNSGRLLLCCSVRRCCPRLESRPPGSTWHRLKVVSSSWRTETQKCLSRVTQPQ